MLLVFRLGHRLPRDERISTHVALVARAFGADGIYYSGEKDKGLEESVKKICEKWGGKFFIKYEANPMFLKNVKKKFTIVHLTMYGMPLNKKINKIKKEKNILVVVGSEKVPAEIYQIADYNIAIGNQPHSEVGALAVFLHEYFGWKQLNKKFTGARIEIEPSERGKSIIRQSPNPSPFCLKIFLFM
ncbi:MAG: tRNA (cytidine(56)-2'-O)-methyltransferase [Candidatus Anstonellales archaeon]